MAILDPTAPTREIGVQAYADGAFSHRADQVATEEPLEIRLAGEPLAVVMRTPGDDMDLTAGFLAAEGIVRAARDIGTMRYCRQGTDPDLQNVVDVVLSGPRADTAEAALARRRAERATVTSTSCGVCGKRSIEALHCDAPPFEAPPVLEHDVILALPPRLRQMQAVFQATGGLHAAAVFTAQGELLVAREDVGRHNAVDKCVGHLLLEERAPEPGMVLMVSGRTSFEIIQKALNARIQTVLAVSAPSSLAVELARASRMGLVGFLRGGAFNVYAGEVAPQA
ncbi:MAG: formate dehydrogenase accessory sulfurtransferase FdhD [Myxococcales bacterium]|nr:formate dehydrogenase accessory sulfurtransferase FdhD [Myxococcales bacterium]MCB9651172.1 formate dehydrogenase accessory sulfurtransferase FdhD [Deltaproteobacteria bacterium]